MEEETDDETKSNSEVDTNTEVEKEELSVVKDLLNDVIDQVDEKSDVSNVVLDHKVEESKEVVLPDDDVIPVDQDEKAEDVTDVVPAEEPAPPPTPEVHLLPRWLKISLILLVMTSWMSLLVYCYLFFITV